MSATIQIKLTPQALETIKDFKKMPTELPRAIKRGMDKALEITTGRIQEKRLSGKGPFPPALHRLGQVTQQLTRSTRAIPAKVISTGQTPIIEGAIGSSVIYAAVHEFGGKRAPERAPFRTGIKENLNYITEQIEKEIVLAAKGLK